MILSKVSSLFESKMVSPDCSVCFRPESDVYLPCFHWLHRTCLNGRQECPQCMQPHMGWSRIIGIAVTSSSPPPAELPCVSINNEAMASIVASIVAEGAPSPVESSKPAVKPAKPSRRPTNDEVMALFTDESSELRPQQVAKLLSIKRCDANPVLHALTNSKLLIREANEIGTRPFYKKAPRKKAAKK